MLDYFFVGKISYYMVTPATSFCDADSKTKKLVGGGSVYNGRQKTSAKTFILVQGTPEAYETSAARSYVLLRRTPRAPGIFLKNSDTPGVGLEYQ